MSSSVCPRLSRRRRIRNPRDTKNSRALTTTIHLLRHEQKHHEQNSWTPNCVNDTLRERERRDVAADPRKQKWIPHLRLAFIAQQLPRELQALTEPKPLFVRTKAQNQMRVCSRLYQFMIVPRCPCCFDDMRGLSEVSAKESFVTMTRLTTLSKTYSFTSIGGVRCSIIQKGQHAPGSFRCPTPKPYCTEDN